MTSIETWIQHPTALAIATTLLHSLWQAAIIALGLAAGLRFIHTSRLRYASACAALLGMVAIPIATFIYVAPRSDARVLFHRSPDPEAAFPAGATNIPAAESARSILQTALPWITPIWLIGVLVFNARQAARWVAAKRIRQRGVCHAPDAWQERLNSIRSRLKVARSVLLLESCLAQVPLAVGHVRPVILVPIGFLTGLPLEQVELILMHELAHVRRGDYLINMLQTFVESVMFYNPATWWVSNLIRIEREHCCDDMVVSAASRPHAYAAALVALEENRSRQAELALAATGGSLMNRIRRVLQQPDTTSALPGVPILAVVLVVIMAGLLAARPTLPVEPAGPEIQATAPQGALRVWLEEDVAYIITDRERAAFLALLTDAERSRFIDQFWQRRDPTPGTAVNEFKEEHYRRVAYANANFKPQLPFLAGWKTDRGRTYIQWGPPDELEVHAAGGFVRPDGSRQTYPNQFWLYRYIEGIGKNVLIEFADPKGTAEYPRVINR